MREIIVHPNQLNTSFCKVIAKKSSPINPFVFANVNLIALTSESLSACKSKKYDFIQLLHKN